MCSHGDIQGTSSSGSRCAKRTSDDGLRCRYWKYSPYAMSWAGLFLLYISALSIFDINVIQAASSSLFGHRVHAFHYTTEHRVDEWIDSVKRCCDAQTDEIPFSSQFCYQVLVHCNAKILVCAERWSHLATELFVALLVSQQVFWDLLTSPPHGWPDWLCCRVQCCWFSLQPAWRTLLRRRSLPLRGSWGWRVGFSLSGMLGRRGNRWCVQFDIRIIVHYLSQFWDE